ncbi:MAG TPA: GNAT family N-acetyltransferase [Candidatus Norongarragalinales archaeon]|nr:GNAT family N-acetyltransferase [Candidatus Norongarragalinales archaeon]
MRENCVWVDWSWVQKDFRGKGLGRKLYEALFNHARQKGFARVACDVFTVNEGSQAFHRKVGFEEKIRIYTKNL